MSMRQEEVKKKIVLGVSESILSSWGAVKLDKVFRKLELEVEYHCHRSPLVIEKVEAGIYDLGFCSGKISNPRSLISESLASEELVLVADSPKKFQAKAKDILSIEKSSATWKSIQSDFKKSNLNPIKEVESFFSIGQLAKAGYGIGLIPVGVAEALGIKKNCIQSLRPKLFRPVQIIYKKSKLERAYFGELVEELKKVR
jgi:DNA-binding transcriptional LysR family regulator